MNVHQNLEELRLMSTQERQRVLGRLLRFLVEVLSSPNGNQAGWEGGARGL